MSDAQAQENEGETPSEATPAADAVVHMTISNAGSLAAAKDGGLMAVKDVTVTDIDKNGILTYDEALRAAHEAYYEGGAASGYGVSEDGSYITRLWGNSTTACGFWLNDTSCYSLTDPVKADDYLTAFVYKNASMTDGDSYTKFGQKEYSAAVGEAVTVSVEKASYDEQYNAVFSAFDGAVLTPYDSSFKTLATEDYTIDGYNVTFHKAGTYYLVIGGTENVNLVPAVAKVVVQDGTEEKSYLSSLQVSPLTPVSYTEIFELGKKEFEYKVPSNQVVRVRIKAAFSEDAPEGSTIKLSYTNSRGVITKNKDITKSVLNTGAMIASIADAGFKENSLTFTVGTAEDSQIYVINMPRVIGESTLTISDKNGKLLNNENNMWYLPEDGGDIVKIKVVNAETNLKLNGVSIETSDYFDYSPEFDKNNECKLEVVATHEEQSITQTYILKKSGEGISGTCGENLKWRLNDNELTISGTGDMTNWELDYNKSAPGWYAYKDSIESIIIESGVTSVGNYAFYRYSKIKKINLPDSIKSIGTFSFNSCYELEDFVIPSDVGFIGNGAFAFCPKLENITISTLSTGIFRGCSGLKSVFIKGNAKEIPENAFLDCTNLSEVAFSAEIEKLADNAFGNCQSLTKIDLPSSVINMSALTFNGCSSLKELNIDNDYYRCLNGILYSADLNTLVFCLPTIEGKVIVSDGVIKIDKAAFKQCEKITEIILPDSVTGVGEECFYGCTELKEVILSDYITSIDAGIFKKCISLESVRLPQTIQKIPDRMFEGCVQLSAIEIPEEITTVGEYAFYGCKSLKSIALPTSVETIGAYAFMNCTGITNFVIPDGVRGISKSMLSACSGLEEIVIPESIEFIENAAFAGSPLKYVFFKGTESQWQNISGIKPEFPAWPSKIFYGATHLGDEKDSPVIIEQPQDMILKKDEAAIGALSVEIQQVEGASYYFKWYKNTKYQVEGAVPVEGVVSEKGLSSTCTPETKEEGNLFYYCLVEKIDTSGAATWSYSDIVTVAVSAGYFQGYGTPKAPYLLNGTEDIVKLKTLVGEGNNMSGLYFQMTTDITLPGDWEPIGEKIDKDKLSIEAGANLHAFSGNFDGNGKTIIVPADGLPLFGYVIDARIQNLNIYGERIAGYGLINNMEGVKLSGNAVIIDNVTLKSGSSTLKSGFVGANVTESSFAGCSSGFETIIRNSIIEKDVIIGYNKDQSMIGSFAGRLEGVIEKCVSHATVYGTSYVGGIAGSRDNAMGGCYIKECLFDGNVEASDTHAGGIVGGGYRGGSAPNGIKITINNCSSSGIIVGKDRVGGILGGDSYVKEAWNLYSFKGNSFDGTVKATAGTYVGGVIGYYESLDVYDDITNNYYSENCGAAKGIGWVNSVDTNCEIHETESGATYVNTEEYHRTDDPLGADAEKLASTQPLEVYVEKIELSGNYKTDFYLGEDLDLSGLVVTAYYNNETEKNVALSDLTITGYDNKTRGNQTLTLDYEGAKANINIRMLRKGDDIKVSFRLLGDTNHGEDGSCHVLAENNLTGWVPEKEYTVDTNATVFDVIQVSAKEYGFEVLSKETQYGTYIYGIKYNGVELEEFTNGNYSGWMYTLNGVHTDKGVAAQYLEDGDVIVFHYTDDYQKEDAAQKEAEEIQETLTKLPEAADITLADKAAVEAARKAYDSLSETQKAMISASALKKLTDAEAKIAELEKPAVHEHTFDAGKVTKEATCKEAGVKTYTCTVCGFEKTEAIPKTDTHTFDAGKVTKEATYKEAGVKTYTCTVCGFQKTEVIPVIAHDHDFTWTVVSQATVFAAEKQEGICSICGEKQTRDNGTALTATIKLNVKSIPLQKKQTIRKVKVTMANGDSVVSWKSSNKKIVTVDKNGVIKAGKKKGTAKITVTLKSGKQATLTVKVQTAKVATKKITGLKSTVTLKKGKKLALKPILTPITSQDKITYTSSNKKIVTVSSKGVITGKKKGTAKITVKAGKKKVTVKVKVK